MEALGANKYGSYEDVLDWVSYPEVPSCDKPEDVLIKVAYSDVNPVDLQKLQGKSRGGNAPSATIIPGYGGTGTVVEVGSKGPQHLIGKSVCFLGDPHRPGSYATHTVAHGKCVAELPSNVDPRDAATIPVAGLTAYECLVKLGYIRDITIQDGKLNMLGLNNNSHDKDNNNGKQKKKINTLANRKQDAASSSLLIVGGSGGVGSWIITLMRLWYPSVKIIATASSSTSSYSEKEEYLKKLGVSQVMSHDDISKKLQGGYEGSVHSIICLTEPTPSLFNALSEVIQPYGSICLVVSGTSIESLNLGFCFFKCVNVFTETVFASHRTKYKTILPSEELAVILQLISNQTIKVPMSPSLISGGKVSEKFKDALKDNGILKLLANNPSRRGKLVLRINAGDEIIFMDLKTASFLKFPKKDCIEQKILTPVDKKIRDHKTWKEESSNDDERKELIEKLTQHKTLGVGKVHDKQETDHEDGLDLQEAENVKNLWGVSLKKREKNKKGEEFLFVDPQRGSIGELCRNTCIKAKFFTVAPKDSTEVVAEAITDANEKDDVIQSIRYALKLVMN